MLFPSWDISWCVREINFNKCTREQGNFWWYIKSYLVGNEASDCVSQVGKWFTIIEYNVDTSINRFKVFITKSKNRDQTQHKQHKHHHNNSNKKIKWEGKAFLKIFHVANKRNLPREDLTWLRKGNLRRETKSLQIAVHNNTILPNTILRYKIYCCEKCLAFLNRVVKNIQWRKHQWHTKNLHLYL